MSPLIMPPLSALSSLPLFQRGEDWWGEGGGDDWGKIEDWFRDCSSTEQHVYVCGFFMCSLVPSGSPVNVTAEAVSSSRIMLSWAALPQAQRNGVVLGYKVNKALKHTLSPAIIFSLDPQPIITSSNTIIHSHTQMPTEVHTKIWLKMKMMKYSVTFPICSSCTISFKNTLLQLLCLGPCV